MPLVCLFYAIWYGKSNRIKAFENMLICLYYILEITQVGKKSSLARSSKSSNRKLGFIMHSKKKKKRWRRRINSIVFFIVRNSLRLKLPLICSLVILSRRKPIHKKFQINMKSSLMFGNCELLICSGSHHRGLQGNYCLRGIPYTAVERMYSIVEMIHPCQINIFKTMHLNCSAGAFSHWQTTDRWHIKFCFLDISMELKYCQVRHQNSKPSIHAFCWDCNLWSRNPESLKMPL